MAKSTSRLHPPQDAGSTSGCDFGKATKLKIFRAVMASTERAEDELQAKSIVSDTDFDALRQAQGIFGPKIRFELWDRDRLVLRFQPVKFGEDGVRARKAVSRAT